MVLPPKFVYNPQPQPPVEAYSPTAAPLVNTKPKATPVKIR